MENWDQAAKLFMADDSQAYVRQLIARKMLIAYISTIRMVNKCLLKVAHFAAQLEQYDKAIENLESVSASSIDNPLTKWSVKEYFFKAGLCYLCKGVSFPANNNMTQIFQTSSRTLWGQKELLKNTVLWMLPLKVHANTSFFR